MTNANPFWKILLLAAVLFIGAIFALPNIFGSDLAVQIAGNKQPLAAESVDRAKAAIEAGGFNNVEFREENDRFVAIFQNQDEQLQAYDAVRNSIEQSTTTVALNLVSASPAWLRNISEPMYLGLDLRGGAHFLFEVDMDEAIKSAETKYVSDWKRENRAQKVRGYRVEHRDGSIVARYNKVEDRDRMLERFLQEGRDLNFDTSEDDKYFYIKANLTEEAIQTEKSAVLQQNISTLRSRVNELGVSEPVIQQQGLDRIVVQLPGIQDPERAKRILGATATLEYRLVYGSFADWQSAATGSIPPGARLYKQREDGSPILLSSDIIVTGDQIKDAASGFSQDNGSPSVSVTLDGVGAKRMQAVTQENVGNLMAVVYRENRIETTMVNGKEVEKEIKTEEVINAATIRDVLSHRFQTTGLSGAEANDLALLLRAGSLKAPIKIVEERTVGPSLGADNIRQGFMSAVVGLALVVAFMAFYYRVFGLVAGMALVVNVVLIVAVLSALQATLTLPGIAGIVLTTGMAVDANVLIFERIREEIRSGSSIQSAIASGYDKAFVTIADANVTTLIAAVVLFSMGTGAIKGFAITLCIGILTSMFTAIFASRVVINAIYGGKRVKALAI
jgi:preprotein translocase subunit SecD